MKTLRFILLPLACVFLAGCLELTQTITLHKDGSMLVSLMYAIPTAHYKSLEAAQKTISKWQQEKKPAPPSKPVEVQNNWFGDKTAVETFFQHPEDGVQLKIYKQFQRDNHTCIEIVIEAKNAEKAIEAGYFGNLALSHKNGIHDLTMTFPTLENLPKEEIARMRKLCGNLYISVEINTPGDIKEQNGVLRNNRRAAWNLSADGRGIDIFGTVSPFHVIW